MKTRFGKFDKGHNLYFQLCKAYREAGKHSGVPTWHAADLRVAGESLRAEADRLVVLDEALGVGAAVAGVHTVAVVAGLSLGAVVIGGAAYYHHR